MQTWTLGEPEEVAPDEDTQEWRIPILEDGSEVAAAYGLTIEEATTRARILAAAPQLYHALAILSQIKTREQRYAWKGGVSLRFRLDASDTQQIENALRAAEGGQPADLSIGAFPYAVFANPLAKLWGDDYAAD
jgi:hypothetical protein